MLSYTTPLSNPSKTNPSPDPLLQRIYGLFGPDHTLVAPVTNGQIVVKGWPNYTVSQSKEPEKQKILASCNDLAVCCGPQSSDLAAVSFPDLKRREHFLDKNPKLKGTLLTSSPGGFFVWIRFNGLHPGHFEHALFEWLPESVVVIASRGPAASQYRLDHEACPVHIPFKDIIWPGEISKAWAVLLAALEYPVEKKGARGWPKFNDDFLASVWMKENSGLWFDPRAKTFYQEPEFSGGFVQSVALEEVKRRLHQTLTNIKNLGSQSVMPLPVDTSLRHLGRLVTLLRILAARPAGRRIKAPPPPPTEEAVGFASFIKAGLEAAPGDRTLTVEELYATYVAFCLSGSFPRYSKRQFQDRLAKALKQAFSVGQSHDVIRENMAKRGFRHLRIKPNTGPNLENTRTDRTTSPTLPVA